MIKENVNYCKNLDLNIKEIDKSLPIKYRLPKIHKTSIGARFIEASKDCSTKPLSDTTFKFFKIIFHTVERFCYKSFFYSDCNKFRVVQNSFPIVIKLNKIS